MRRIIVVAALIAGLGLLGWLTLARVDDDGTTVGWSAAGGTLKVPDGGLALLPRWSYERLGGGAIETVVGAATRDGVPVSVSVRFTPPVGLWNLAPAETPAAALQQVASQTVRPFLGNVPLGCLVSQGSAEVVCPVDAELQLVSLLAVTLRVPESAVGVALHPDDEAVRSFLLQSIGARLGTLPEHKVLLLGLDGLEWNLILPWVEAGRLPNLERLMRAGSWGEMDTIVPLLSPLIWTTIATGVSPDQHGVLDFVERDPASGAMIPVTGRNRKVPAIWNLTSALDLSTDVVAWWATWPAERINGVMITDRFYYARSKTNSNELVEDNLPDLVYPSERYAELNELRQRALDETDWATMRYFMPISEELFDSVVAEGRGMEDPVDGFRRILAAARTYLGAGLTLASSQPDLMVVYLEGTDTIGHLLSPYMPPPTLEVDPAEATVYVAAVPKYFEVVDRWIGRYLEVCPLDEYAVIIVSDHGFRWKDDRPKGLSGTNAATAPMWHTENAVFIVAGAGVERRGRVRERGSVYQVAPSVAALLGMPGDVSWERSVLPGCPEPRLEPIDYLALVSPESYQQSGGDAVPVDPDYIARLEALGYLASGDEPDQPQQPSRAPTMVRATPTPRPAAPKPVPTAPPQTITRGQLNNLGLVKLNEGKYDEAEEAFRAAIAMSPDYAGPHYNLRRMYMEQGKYDDADRQLWIAVEKGLRDAERSVDRAARDYENMSEQDRAAGILAEGVRRFPQHEPLWVHLLVVKIRSEDYAEGVAIGREAARRFPESGPVHTFYGTLAAFAGDVPTARRELTRALEMNPDQPLLRQMLNELPAE